MKIFDYDEDSQRFKNPGNFYFVSNPFEILLYAWESNIDI